MQVGVLLGVGLMVSAGAAKALTTSDRPAAILIWPKIVSDPAGLFGPPTDTVVQLSNTDQVLLKQAHCFYVNANSHCGANATNAGQVCENSSQCPSGAGFASCDPGWSEEDFDIFITKDQPLAWDASAGLGQGQFPINTPGVCHNLPTRTCTQATASLCPGGVCDLQQSNLGGGIPPVPEVPFVGSLTCVEFNPGVNPASPDTSNTLIGHGTIESSLGGTPTVQKYSAVGIQSTGFNNGDNELLLNTSEYNACPQTLLLTHLFDGGLFGPAQTTDLTLVPCGNNFLTQTPGVVTAQFLVFNEFEQRFSTSRTVDCFFEHTLSTIDTTVPTRSIFNFAVAGTFAGQTRIRGVGDAATGRGLVGIARPFVGPFGAAYNLQEVGDPDFNGTMGAPVQADVITIP